MASSLTPSSSSSSLPAVSIELTPLPPTHSRASLLDNPLKSTEALADQILKTPVVVDVREDSSSSIKKRKCCVLNKCCVLFFIGLGSLMGGFFYQSIKDTLTADN